MESESLLLLPCGCRHFERASLSGPNRSRQAARIACRMMMAHLTASSEVMGRYVNAVRGSIRHGRASGGSFIATAEAILPMIDVRSLGSESSAINTF